MLTWLARYRRALALAALLTLSAPSAHAILDPTGPVRIAILLRIAAVMAEINRAADAIARATRSIKERQEELFPREALEEIGSVFQQVRDLRDDLEELRAGWELSVPADRVRQALSEEADLLREEWETLWGRASGPGHDLQDLAGWNSNRRYRSAASYLAVHDDWAATASNLAHQARAGGEGEASALRSIRLTAVASALSLQQSAASNKLAAEQLDAAQEDLDQERHEELLAQALGNLLLRPLRGADVNQAVLAFDEQVRS